MVRVLTLGGIFALFLAPCSAVGAPPPLELRGFWIINETGASLNRGLASVPLVGLLFKDASGHERTVWEIREKNGETEIYIAQRNLTFFPVSQTGTRFQSETKDSVNGHLVRLDATISADSVDGSLRYGDVYQVVVKGQPPEAVRQARLETQEARRTISALQQRLDATPAPRSDPALITRLEQAQQLNEQLTGRIAALEGRSVRSEPLSSAAPTSLSPSRVTTTNLPANSISDRDLDVRSAPLVQAPIVSNVARAQAFHRIAITSDERWALLVTPDGLVGYAPTESLKPYAEAPERPAALQNEIDIEYPLANRAGRIQVPAAGFITIAGTVHASAPIQQLELNGQVQRMESATAFNLSVFVPAEGQTFRLVAILRSGGRLTKDLQIRVQE